MDARWTRQVDKADAVSLAEGSGKEAAEHIDTMEDAVRDAVAEEEGSTVKQTSLSSGDFADLGFDVM